MSSLTEEQKRKIEESRRKALAIRAAKEQQKPLPTGNSVSGQPGASTASCSTALKKKPDIPSWLGIKTNNVQNSGANKVPNPSKRFSVAARNVSSTSSPSKSKPAGNLVKVTGKCVLVSRERFVVEVGYSAPLIALFKNMQTKQYGKCKN